MNASCVSRAFDLKSTSTPHLSGLNTSHTKRKKVENVFDFCQVKQNKKKEKKLGLDPWTSSSIVLQSQLLSTRPDGHASTSDSYLFKVLI